MNLVDEIINIFDELHPEKVYIVQKNDVIRPYTTGSIKEFKIDYQPDILACYPTNRLTCRKTTREGLKPTPIAIHVNALDWEKEHKLFELNPLQYGKKWSFVKEDLKVKKIFYATIKSRHKVSIPLIRENYLEEIIDSLEKHNHKTYKVTNIYQLQDFEEFCKSRNYIPRACIDNFIVTLDKAEKYLSGKDFI